MLRGLGILPGAAEKEMGGQKAFALLSNRCQQRIHRQIRHVQIPLELVFFQAAAAGRAPPSSV